MSTCVHERVLVRKCWPSLPSRGTCLVLGRSSTVPISEYLPPGGSFAFNQVFFEEAIRHAHFLNPI